MLGLRSTSIIRGYVRVLVQSRALIAIREIEAR
jgi:hypothetical protein